MKDGYEYEQYAVDALIGRPNGFSIGGRHFYLYPVTMGKMHILRPLVDSLGLNLENMMLGMSFEVLRLAKEKRKECIDIIFYHTCLTREEVFDQQYYAETTAFLDKEFSEDDVAALLAMTLGADKTEGLIKHYGIDKEQDAMAQVMRVKGGKNDLTFGGKTVFGALLDTACERYGWTKDYVVWGIDYTSLRMMLADKVTSVYLSDDEMQKVPLSVISRNEDVVEGKKENMEAIKAMGWK